VVGILSAHVRDSLLRQGLLVYLTAIERKPTCGIILLVTRVFYRQQTKCWCADLLFNRRLASGDWRRRTVRCSSRPCEVVSDVELTDQSLQNYGCASWWTKLTAEIGGIQLQTQHTCFNTVAPTWSRVFKPQKCARIRQLSIRVSLVTEFVKVFSYSELSFLYILNLKFISSQIV